MILKKITGYTIISLFISGISFLLLPVITAYLTPEDYGILSIFNASTNFLIALIPLGMNHILNVQIIKNNTEYPEKLTSFIKITAGIALFTALLLSFTSVFLSDFFGLPFVFTVFIPFIALMVIYYQVAISYFVFIKQLLNYAKLTLTKFFIEYLFVIVLVVLIPLSWKGRILALIMSLVIVLFFLLFYFSKKKILLFNKSLKAIDISMLKDGLPLISMGISIMIMNLSDRFFIEYFVGLKATGLYGIASTIAGILLMVIGSSLNVIRPMIYEKLRQGGLDFGILTFRYVIGLLFITICLMAITPFTFEIMIDHKYLEGIKFTYPLILGLFFWGMFSYQISFLLYAKKNLIIGIISVAGVLINLGLNYFLISSYSAMGAAYATLLTYFSMWLMIFILSFVLK